MSQVYTQVMWEPLEYIAAHTEGPLTREPFTAHTDVTGSGVETGSDARSGDGRQT